MAARPAGRAPAAAPRTSAESGAAHGAADPGRGGVAGELAAEVAGKRGPARGEHGAVRRMVVLAERDASRRTDLFAAIRKAVSAAGWARPDDAELVVRMATVLLDAGRPVEYGEVSRRMRERWGTPSTEPALYAARFSGAIRVDTCGVLYLRRPAGEGKGMGEEWMYEALERAVGLGAARYTDGGIEMTGDAGGLSARELAGAEAVARGVTAYGEPPGLSGWLETCRMSGGGGERTTWAEATVGVRAAGAEVGAAWARISAERALAPAAARG